MNLGHRVRIAQNEELKRENARLREILLEVAPEEIDLRAEGDENAPHRMLDDVAVGDSR